MQAHLDGGNPARSLPMDADERQQLRDHKLITAKPVQYIANVDEDGLKDGNAYLKQVRADFRRTGQRTRR